MTSNLIAVTGATGALGGRVAARLAALAATTRLIVRDGTRAPRLAGSTVAEVPGGYGDTSGFAAALDGVHTLFLVSATESADRESLHTAAVDAAVAARIQRVVYVSFAGAAPHATFTFARDHWHTEEAIRAAGIPHTILRNNLYLDVLPYFTGPDDVLRGPAGHGRFGGVARDDIADAAAAILAGLTPDSVTTDGVTFDLTGPEAITMDDVAAGLTRATGRLITYDAETLDQAYASRSTYGAPDWEVAGWVTSYAAIAAGELDIVTTHVADLTGHEPMSFARYLDRNPPPART